MGKRRERGILSVIALMILCVLLIGVLRNKSVDVDLTEEKRIQSDIYANDTVTETVQTEEQDRVWILFDTLAFERKETFVGTALFSLVIIGYIVLIGLVIYFYLKRKDRMEWMWGVIPAVAVLFTVIIMAFRSEVMVREPVVDTVTVLSPEEENNVEYISSISPGRESYRLSFTDSVAEVIPIYLSGEESVGEENLFVEITPEHAFSEGYFRVDLKENTQADVVCELKEEEDAFSGRIVNTTEWDFSHIFLYGKDQFYLEADVAKGEEFKVSPEGWQGRAPEGAELNLENDMKNLIEFGYHKYLDNTPDDTVRVLGIIAEYESSVTNEELDQISYGLYYTIKEIGIQ